MHIQDNGTLKPQNIITLLTACEAGDPGATELTVRKGLWLEDKPREE